MSSTLLLGETYMEVQTRSTVSQTEPPTTSLRPSLRGRGRSAMTTTACHRTTLEMPACACRKLGRDFGNLECRQKRRFRRNKEWFSAMEEKISTGKLHELGVESQPFLEGTDQYGITSNFHSLSRKLASVLMMARTWTLILRMLIVLVMLTWARHDHLWSSFKKVFNSHN
ncbi:hypothetical protein PsorP6_011807 [Peronosclerospora sorghi]|uniref:Uncharacterized protein n=1 Tax=Peronosclerospora sorghi TaxID=230839 RepID=A0ACC0WLR4_9STRA|nr:hypothetical protein PsorP6_011807 [Peronosclerospora sorghi]